MNSNYPLVAVNALLITCVMLITTGCGSVTREIEQTSANTAAMEISVKRALIDAEDIDAAAVAVTFAEDTITLRGFVGSQSEKDRAEELAKANSGATPVINFLEVQP